MKKGLFMLPLLFVITMQLAAQIKYVSRTGKAVIFSHTLAEDITAANNNVTGLVNETTGDIAVSVPVQSFLFEKALMQEHFNNANFMDSKQFPKISLKGKIVNLQGINFLKDGMYEVTINGELTIKGVSKPVTEKAHLTIKNGQLAVHCKFVVNDIGSYGVGKPKGKMKNNVADDIEVTYTATFEKE